MPTLVDDELWQLLEPLLPRPPRRYRHPGRRRLDDRKVFSGILFVLSTGIAWQRLPQELGYGSGMTCWRRLHEWQQAGAFQHLHQLSDRALAGVAKFCSGGGKPPELGGLRFFLMTAANSTKRLQTSSVLQAFARVAALWRGRDWILSNTGALALLQEITDGYRNRAAHTGELAYDDYVRCRELVVGDGGLLPLLAEATD